MDYDDLVAQAQDELNATSPFAGVWGEIEARQSHPADWRTVFTPNPGPQAHAIESDVYELLYGGAAGGGKSEWLLHDGLKQVAHPQYKALILRRTFPELRELIDRSLAIFPRLGGKWNEQSKRWVFPSGATYQFGYCGTYAEVLQYQGQQFAWIGFDELGQVSEERIWTYLMSRNRSPFRGVKTCMRATANPGGPGHNWLKRRFVALCRPDGTPYIYEPVPGSRPMSRGFIQAFLSDNQALTENDPLYGSRLDMLPEVERAWLKEGDWNAGAGQALSDLSYAKHLIAPFEIPSHWVMFGAFDWGFNHPFSFGLFATDQDGNVYLVESVAGRHLQPLDIIQRIKETLKERGYDIRRVETIVAGHDCWADRKARGETVPTIAEQFYDEKLWLDRANISRVSGLQNFRRYLTWRRPTASGPEDFTPRFRVFDTPSNRKVFECLEGMVSDPDNIEDVLKVDANDRGEGGDDAYDMVRYGLASRPISASAPVIEKKHEPFQDLIELVDADSTVGGTFAQFGTWI